MNEAATGIDRTIPHSARMWNYWLGGKDNYQVDRDAAEAMLAIYPAYGIKARTCRYFLFRAVRFLTVEEGVRQFLDIGTGLPTAENTHEVAQQFAPESRIVYVDNDPLVLAHARSLLTSSRGGRHPLHRRRSARTRPDPRRGARGRWTSRRRSRCCCSACSATSPTTTRPSPSSGGSSTPCRSGSYLVHCDGTTTDDVLRQGLGGLQGDRSAFPTSRARTSRSSRYFAGLEMIEPGVVPIHQWRPEPGLVGVPAAVDESGGIGRKPLTPG